MTTTTSTTIPTVSRMQEPESTPEINPPFHELIERPRHQEYRLNQFDHSVVKT